MLRCVCLVVLAQAAAAEATGSSSVPEGGAVGSTTDSRDARVPWGTIFSAGGGTGYSDQPQVIVFNASYWLCVITCSPGHEGQRSQIVGTTVSTDGGSVYPLLVQLTSSSSHCKQRRVLASTTPTCPLAHLPTCPHTHHLGVRLIHACMIGTIFGHETLAGMGLRRPQVSPRATVGGH
jgi:hypothetical protein